MNIENILTELKKISDTKEKIKLERKLVKSIELLRLNRKNKYFDTVNIIKDFSNKNPKVLSKYIKEFLISETLLFNKSNFILFKSLSLKNSQTDLYFEINKLSKELNDILRQPLENILTDGAMSKILSLNQNIFLSIKKIIKFNEPNLINILKDAKNEEFSVDNPINLLLNSLTKMIRPLNIYQKRTNNMILNLQTQELHQKEPKFSGEI